MITVLIWTSFIVVARASARHNLTSFDISFLRYVAAACVLIPVGIWLVKKRAVSDSTLPSWLGMSPASFKTTALIGSIAGIAYPILAYSGFFFAPAAHASVLLPGSLPLWTTLIALLILKTPITAMRAVGLAMILAGDLFVGGASLLKAFDGGDVWVGDLLFLGASCSWATYSVLTRKLALPAINATVALTVFAALTFVPVYGVLAYSGVIPSKLSQAPWSEIFFQAIYQGIGSVVISGITFVKMIEIFGPIRSTMITAIVPSLSALAAVFFLNEPLGWNLWIGLVMVTIGITFGIRANPNLGKVNSLSPDVKVPKLR